MLKVLLGVPFVCQTLAMVIDEFHFHRTRGLPLWERWGHPLDTLSVWICYGFLILFSPLPERIQVFAGIACLSCILVTKDEFVHHRLCSAGEQWLHSLLFILHPICFFTAGWMWWKGGFETIFAAQFLFIFIFFIYQTFYWNLLWKPKP